MIARIVAALLLTLAAISMMVAAPARANEPRVIYIDPVIRGDQLTIDAEIDIPLNEQLRDAAQRGLPLYFTADLQITSPRWWWLDRSVADSSLTWRVSYNALTRQWRVGQGELSLNVASLDDAMDVLRHIRNWPVAAASEFKAGDVYQGQLRVRLDTSMLARPFQVNALNSSSWTLATPWLSFSFTLTEPVRDPA